MNWPFRAQSEDDVAWYAQASAGRFPCDKHLRLVDV